MEKEPLHVAIIHMQAKAECVEQFKKAAAENAACSRQESGVVRFDVLQDQKDPTKFVLNEIYKTPADQLAHRETEHFKRFKAAAGEYLAMPYTPEMFHFVSGGPDGI